MRTIRSKAPTRIDLAGGTLDIWPLYLLLDNPVTINVAISLYAETELNEFKNSETSADAGIEFITDDQQASIFLKWSELDRYQPPPALELLVKLARFFKNEKVSNSTFDSTLSVRLRTRAQSPAGAGLGGSSALAISLIGALKTWAVPKSQSTSVDWISQLMKQGTELINVAKDIESTVIKVPAGLQDYHGSLYGGLQKLEWRPGVNARSAYSADLLKMLQNHLILFYSGKSRNSGINNWTLFKNLIDGDRSVRDHFQAIANSTLKLDTALSLRDFSAAQTAIADEWNVRRHLAQSISTPEIDKAFHIAQELGIRAGKICGAGGGGCFFFFLPSTNPDLRKELINRVVQTGVEHLEFHVCEKGLEVTQS